MPNTNSPKKTPVPASLSKRLMAMLYDGILVTALLMIASAIATGLVKFLTGADEIAQGNPLMMLWLLGIGFLYYGVSWKVSGQTLGLRTWRLRVTTEQNQALEWKTVIVRYLLATVLFFSLVGFLWMIFNKNKQTLYDILSHTKITDEKKSGVQADLD